MADQRPPPLPPPGWYPDPNGALRWWDGVTWGPAAPSGSPSSSRTLAVVAHLGSFLGGFLLPLIIYLTADVRDRYVRHHAREALNFQITVMVVWLVGFVVLVAATFGGVLATSGSDAGPVIVPVAMVAVWGLMMLALVGSMGLSVLGAVRAYQGEWWRYPVCLRLVRGDDAPEPSP